MIVFILAMLAVLALAVGVVAMVMMGMQGSFRDRHPRLARRLGTLARHLNGEAEIPQALRDLIPRR